MSGECRECPENLLPEHDACELVWQGQWAKRKALIGVVDESRIKAHRTADQERRRSGIIKARTAPGGERLARRRSTAGRVEGNHECSLKDPSTNTVTLASKHLVRAALQRLRCHFIHPESDTLCDPALIFTGRVSMGCADGPNNDELEPWVPHGGVS